MKQHELHPLVKQVLDGERPLTDLPLELREEGERAGRLLMGGIDRGEVTLSADLESRVMATVRRRAGSPTGRLWSWLSVPSIPRWALAAAVVAAATVAVLVRTSPGGQAVEGPLAAAGRESVYVRFELYAPRAHRVSLAGTFNRWDQAATPLVRVQPDGVWMVTLALPTGQHQYAFIVDGREWVTDPTAPAVDDGFGRRNSVVSVSTVNGRIL